VVQGEGLLYYRKWYGAGGGAFNIRGNVVQGAVQESSGRAELQEHALAKLKARERGASLGPMVTPYSSCHPHDLILHTTYTLNWS
jgi:hypothetical protein